jgi:hypothetical protein
LIVDPDFPVWIGLAGFVGLDCRPLRDRHHPCS